MKILLIGAYGFIGSEVARALIADGHEVVGFGRSAVLGARVLPDIAWQQGDLNRLVRVEDWAHRLHGIDAVVNASGALQSGAQDRLDDSQGRSIIALIAACEAAGVRRFVQISAPGAAADADTEFMRSKADADSRLKQSTLTWTILRPGLVIGRNAYGGTALIRMLAAMPLALVTVHGERRIQTVAMHDVVAAVLASLPDGAASGVDAVLVEREASSLCDVIRLHRRWLGFSPPLLSCDLPAKFARPVGWIADALGWLGWRSPLRTTALRIMEHDIVGDPDEARGLLGRDAESLVQTLARQPLGIQDRWYARLSLLQPLAIAALALFWLTSGIVGLWRIDAAAALLDHTQMTVERARWLTVVGSLADLALGAAIIFRRTLQAAAVGMLLLSAGYLVAGTLLRPDLWLDPLAPMMKIVPAMLLAAMVWAMGDKR